MKAFNLTSISLILMFAGIVLNPPDAMSQSMKGIKSDTITVNFISIGQGVDYKAEERLKHYLSDFQKENHVSLTYKNEAWGKEGENIFTIRLSNLSKQQREKFLDTLTKMFKDNKLVQMGNISR